MKRFFFSRRTALLLAGVLLAFLLLTGSAMADTVTLPAGLKKVEAEAFMGDNHITQLQVPRGVTRIEAKAFANCYNLVEAHLPSTLSYIADSAFSGCPYVTVMSEAGSYAEAWCEDHHVTFRSSSADASPGINFMIDFIDGQSVRLLYYMGTDTNPSPTIVIPDMIGDERVWMPTEMTDSSFRATVTWLEGKYIVKDISFRYGFKYNITDLTLPNTVNSVPDRAFANLRLQSVTIPDSITSIGEGAFDNCQQLTSVHLSPNSRLTEIKKGAFGGCKSLQSITLPGTMISIGEAAFKGSGLTSVAISDTGHPITIGTSAFEDCYDLENIRLPEGLNSIGAYAFQRTGLTSVSIPETLTSIGYSAFSRCTSLASLVIPENSRLMKIAAYAFMYDSALGGELRLPETLSVLSDNAPFWGSVISKLIIPDTAQNDYGKLLKKVASEALNGIPVTYYRAHHFVYDESTATGITYDALNQNEDNHYVMYTQMICSDPDCNEIKLLDPPVILYEPCDNEVEAVDDPHGKPYEWSRTNYMQHYPKKVHVRCKICLRDEILEGDKTLKYRDQLLKEHDCLVPQSNWLYPCAKCDYVDMETALARAYAYLANKMDRASKDESLTEGEAWESFTAIFNTSLLKGLLTDQEIQGILLEVAEAIYDRVSSQQDKFKPEDFAASQADLAEHILDSMDGLSLDDLSRTVRIGNRSFNLIFTGFSYNKITAGTITVKWGTGITQSSVISFQNGVSNKQGREAIADFLAHLAQLNSSLWETFLAEYFGQLGQIPGFEKINPKNVKEVIAGARKLIQALTDKEKAKELLNEWIGKAADEAVKKALEKLKPDWISNKFLEYIQGLLPSGDDMIEAAKKLANIEKTVEDYKKLFTEGKMTPKQLTDKLNSYNEFYQAFIAEADDI